MIFPDLPKKRYSWSQQPIHQIDLWANTVQEKMNPPQLADDVAQTISADEWFARHFPAQDNQANIYTKYEISASRARWERVEFATICIGLVVWIWYWHQFQ